ASAPWGTVASNCASCGGLLGWGLADGREMDRCGDPAAADSRDLRGEVDVFTTAADPAPWDVVALGPVVDDLGLTPHRPGHLGDCALARLPARGVDVAVNLR